jgi:hypothetical protein
MNVHCGASLRMWKEYFPNAVIHGIDAFAEEMRKEILKEKNSHS